MQHAVASMQQPIAPAGQVLAWGRTDAEHHDPTLGLNTCCGFCVVPLQCLKPDAPAPASQALPKCIPAFVGDCCTNAGLTAGASCGFGGVRKVVSLSPRVVETAGILATRCAC